MSFLSENFQRLQTQIDAACLAANRSPQEVHLLAVSKKQSIDKIKELYDLGQRDFGENYAEEFSQKQIALKNDCPNIRWHFIGQIQSNKTQLIAQAHYVHSIASLRHAKRLSQQTPHPSLAVLIQVNLSEEKHRGGVPKNEISNLVQDISGFSNLNLLGLMAILPIQSQLPASYWFKQMQSLKNTQYPELSMGMSADFEEAILYDATWIRIGSSLFGNRGGQFSL